MGLIAVATSWKLVVNNPRRFYMSVVPCRGPTTDSDGHVSKSLWMPKGVPARATSALRPRLSRLECNPGHPSIQIIPTLGPKVCKYYLRWAIWIPTVRLQGPSWARLSIWGGAGNMCTHTHIPMSNQPATKNY